MLFENHSGHEYSGIKFEYMKTKIEENKLSDPLGKCDDFPEIFELVKKIVKKILNLYRIGLMLVIADLPIRIGAFHTVGSNTIVMNRTLLRIFEKTDSDYKKEFIFLILLHEYLHTLGYKNESEVRILSYTIVAEVFGVEHPLTQIAEKGPFSILPKITRSNIYSGDDPELIKNFEKIKHPYIQ